MYYPKTIGQYFEGNIGIEVLLKILVLLWESAPAHLFLKIPRPQSIIN
jgi:hypothetical protein